MSRKQKGFTLIELLIVVAIIGILAAITIPNLLTAMQRARQKRSMADMRTIATAWESRATEVNKHTAADAHPRSLEFTRVLFPTNLAPTYIKLIPANDGWSQPFHFSASVAWGTAGGRSDERRVGGEGSAWGARHFGAKNDFDCDIVYSGGILLSYPEGVKEQ